MTFRTCSFLLLFFFSITFYSCEDGRSAEEAVEDATEEMVSDARTETEALNAELVEARNAIDARIALLSQDLDEAGDDAREEIQESIRELKDYGSDIDNRMDEIGRDINSGWDEFKRETKSTLKKIEAEIDEEIRD